MKFFDSFLRIDKELTRNQEGAVEINRRKASGTRLKVFDLNSKPKSKKPQNDTKTAVPHLKMRGGFLIPKIHTTGYSFLAMLSIKIRLMPAPFTGN
jgi:hypothetical protein